MAVKNAKRGRVEYGQNVYNCPYCDAQGSVFIGSNRKVKCKKCGKFYAIQDYKWKLGHDPEWVRNFGSEDLKKQLRELLRS